MVFVDDMRADFGQMIMCHMIADSHAELLAMAGRIGVARRHIQHRGTYRKHFDICLSKRELAVEAGAVELSRKELARVVMSRRSVTNA
jgi:Protein of unknown function (DUF4031)